MEETNSTDIYIKREQLQNQLDEYALSGLTVMTAKRGYGKSSLINSWIERSKINAIHISLSSNFDRDESPDPVQQPRTNDNHPHKQLPTINDSNTLWQTVTQQIQGLFEVEFDSYNIENLCDFFQKHDQSANSKEILPNPILIIENYHNSSDKLNKSMVKLLKCSGNNLGVIISTEKNPPRSFFQFFSSDRTLYLSEDQLKFTRKEIKEYIEHLSMNVNEDALQIYNGIDKSFLDQNLYINLGGWPALIKIYLEALFKSIRETEPGQTFDTNEYRNQKIFEYLEETIFNDLNDDLRTTLITTARLPLITPRLLNLLKSDIPLVKLTNKLCESRLLRFTKRFRSEAVNSLPILGQYRLKLLSQHENSNDSASDLCHTTLHTFKDWYLNQGYIGEAICLLFNYEKWDEGLKVFETNLDLLLKKGEWHTVSTLFSHIPKDIISQHPEFLARFTFFFFINQKIDYGFQLLLQFHEVFSQMKNTDEEIPFHFLYLNQFAKNYLAKEKISDSFLESDSLLKNKNSTGNIKPTFFQFLPEIHPLQRINSSPEILILDSYRLIFNNKNLSEAINRLADALESAIEAQNTFLTFHSLLLYIYLTEQIGELKNIHQCCTMLNAWAESKRYCGYSMGLILRFLSAPYTNERRSQESLKSEGFSLSKLIDSGNLSNDPLLEYLTYRNLCTIYHLTGDESTSNLYMGKLKAICPLLSRELISVSSCPHYTLHPRQIWQTGGYAKFGKYVSELNTNTGRPESPLPPFNIESDHYQILEKHRQIMECKTFNNQLNQQKDEATQYSLHYVKLILCLNHAIYLYRSNNKEAIDELIDALKIGTTLGYLRTLVITNRIILDWLPYISNDLGGYTHYGNLLASLGREEPSYHNEDYFTHLTPTVGIKALSKREKEVLSLMVTGMTNEEIANSLHRSVNTVKLHVHKIFRKLGAKNRMEATNLYRNELTKTNPEE